MANTLIELVQLHEEAADPLYKQLQKSLLENVIERIDDEQ